MSALAFVLAGADCNDDLVAAAFPEVDGEGRDAVRCDCFFGFPNAGGLCLGLKYSCQAHDQGHGGGCAPHQVGEACPADIDAPCADDNPNLPPLEGEELRRFIRWVLNCRAGGLGFVPDDSVVLEKIQFTCGDFDQPENADCRGARFTDEFCLAGETDADGFCREICRSVAFLLDWELASNLGPVSYRCGFDPSDPENTAVDCREFDGTCEPNTFVLEPPDGSPSTVVLEDFAKECELPCAEVPCTQDTIETCNEVELDSRVTDGGLLVEECHHGFESDRFCRVPDEDPPVLETGGILQAMRTRRSLGILDEDSYVEIKRGDLQARTTLRGTVDILGDPCPGATCDISVSIAAQGDDVTAGNCASPPFSTCASDDDCPGAGFQVPCVAGGCADLSGPCSSDDDCPILGAQVSCLSTEISDITIHAGTGTSPVVPIDESGRGTISASQLTGTVSLRADGTHRARSGGGFSDYRVTIDWDAGTFTLEDGFVLGDFEAHSFLSGRLVNQPPTAIVSGETLVTCTSPDGADVTLLGSFRDAQGIQDIMSFTWWRGTPTPLAGDRALLGANELGLKVAAPLGTTEYAFRVRDLSLQEHAASIAVTVTNQAPVAVITGTAEVHECQSPEGATVNLSAEQSTDADAHALSFEWRHGGTSALLGVGAVLESTFPLGATPVRLLVRDACGAIAQAETTVAVVDTTPPEIASFEYGGPLCVWPPNHDYVVLDVERDFDAVIVDACDASPELIISSASSSQPDDADGDGHTVDDVVVLEDRVCIRAERRGNDPDGRVYSISLLAEDASGNASDPVVEVSVGHDQRSQSRCVEIGTERVPYDSPRCQAAEDEYPTPTSPGIDASGSPDGSKPDAGPGGCGAAGGNASAPTVLALVLLALLLVRRERPATRAMAVAAATSALGGCIPPPPSSSEQPLSDSGPAQQADGGQPWTSPLAGTWAGEPFDVVSQGAYRDDGSTNVLFHDYVSECPRSFPDPPNGERTVYIYAEPAAELVGEHAIWPESGIRVSVITQDFADGSEGETRILTEGVIHIDFVDEEHVVGWLHVVEWRVDLEIGGAFDVTFCE